jgi:hypothetical protein
MTGARYCQPLVSRWADSKTTRAGFALRALRGRAGISDKEMMVKFLQIILLLISVDFR